MVSVINLTEKLTFFYFRSEDCSSDSILDFLTSLVTATKSLIKNNNIATFESFPGPLPLNPLNYSAIMTEMKSFFKEEIALPARNEETDNPDWKEDNWESQCERCYKYEVNALQNRSRRNAKSANCFSFGRRTTILGVAPNNVPGPGAYYSNRSAYERQSGFSFGTPKQKQEFKVRPKRMSSLHVSSSLYDIGSLRDKISRPRPFDKNGYKRVAEELTRKDIFMPTVAPQHSIRNRRLSNQRGINGNKANNSLSGHIHPGRNAYSRQQTMCKNSINGFKGKQNPFQNEGTTKRPDFSCTEAHSKKWVEHRAVSSMFKHVLSKMQKREYPHVSAGIQKIKTGHYSPIKPISRLRSNIHESKGTSYESSKLEMVIMKRSNVQ